MGIFGSILSKLGIGEDASQVPAEAMTVTDVASTPESSMVTASSPVVISEVDVANKLEELANSHAEKLNWKVSIVDLLKLLDLDSRLATRKKLATELNCPSDKMNDSAEMNVWLHQTVLQKLAANGGNIPTDLSK